jgi:23S rRNA (guanosine2251-2'-O)-methyltransferase
MKRSNSNRFKKNSTGSQHGRSAGGPRGDKREGPRSGGQPHRKGSPVVPPGTRVVVGTHAIREALQKEPRSAQKVLLINDFQSHPELRSIHDEIQSKKIQFEEHPKGFLDNLANGHQGAILLTKWTPSVSWETIFAKPVSTVVFLDGIEDPHNLGAVLRSSWLTKVDAVVVPADRAVGLTPSVHKVACGGVEHVPIETTNNFAHLIEQLKANGFWVFGLSHKAEKNIFDLKVPEKVAWIIGSEDKGLRTSSERSCDELISLPQVSAAASYNASVATSITLMETVRQREFIKS